MAPFGIKAVSFGFLKNLFLLIVILGLPEIIVHRSDLKLCFCKLIEDFGLITNSFNKKSLPEYKLIYLKPDSRMYFSS